MSTDNDTETDNIAALIRSAGRRPTPTAADYEQVLTAATSVWRRKVAARRRNRWTLAAAASVAVIAVTLIPWLRSNAPNPSPVGNTVTLRGQVAIMTPGTSSWVALGAEQAVPLARGARLRTGADGTLALRLGNVDVRVNTASEIELAAPETMTLTAGTVYIDSGPLESDGRLVVTTRFGTLRDIGTQFEVNAGDDVLRLRVREGRVVVEDGPGLRLESTAGEQLTLDTAGQVQRSAFRSDDPAWNWAAQLTPIPALSGQTVQAFLNWVARESGRRVLYEQVGVELQARSVRLSSSANLADLTPLEMLDAVLATTNFAYIIRADGAILIQRR
jgi:ferric-dicitrate binding protein FerR (iron transport regulator)